MSGLCAVFLLILAAFGQAAVLEEAELTGAGKVRAAFLSRGVGARAVGMGEAFVAVANDATAVSWNPGGLGQLTGLNACASYDLIGEGLGLSYLAFAAPAGYGVAGCGVTVLSYGNYDARDESGEIIAARSLTDFAVSLSYGFPNPGFMRAEGYSGFAFEIGREAVGDTFLGISFGALFLTGRGINAGLSVRHLGPSSGGFAMPAVVQAGAALTRELAGRRMRAALDLSRGLADGEFAASLGTEVLFTRSAVLRAGYKHNFQDQALSGISGVTAGLGGWFGQFGLDYAYQPFGELASSHRFALVYAD